MPPPPGPPERMSDDIDSPALPTNGTGIGSSAPPNSGPPIGAIDDAVYQRVLFSDIGVNTLLARLKQSIASAKDFASFLQKRAQIEEGHAAGLKKACRPTHEQARRPESRQGTYLQNYEALTRAHEKMADNGMSFAMSLNQMHDDLLELAKEKEAARKHWKTTGLANEKRTVDAEAAMDKAKNKYHSLAESLHAVKTGDRSGGRLGIKGPKSAAQVEEDTLRKMQAADADYSQRVQTAQAFRKELVDQLRPQAVRALEQLVSETDSALTLQIQKFATFNEKLLLSNGLCVSPLDEAPGKDRSLRQIVQSIDNNLDLKGFVSSFAARANYPPEPQYERHPTQGGQLGVQKPGPPPVLQQPQSPLSQQQQQQKQQPQQSFGVQPPSSNQPQTPQQQQQQQQHQPSNPSHFGAGPSSHPAQQSQQAPRIGDPFSPAKEAGLNQSPATNSPRNGGFPPSFESGPPPPGTYSSAPAVQSVDSGPSYPHQPQGAGSGPPDSKFTGQSQQMGQGPHPGPIDGPPAYMTDATRYSPGQSSFGNSSPAPGRPLPSAQFGLTLQELMDRDGLPVPAVVQQCLQAVDLFGLDVEGIYRVSGNGEHIKRLKEAFDKGSPQIDFRNPETFYHDVNSVAGLLKQFFRDLPDPLMTKQHYRAFVEAARIDNDVARRDSIHATINELPDPNYATLRALVLHLHRVQEHESANKMNAGNLAICFGPTLMVAQNMQNIADAGWQVRVIDTILQNTMQIFDDD